MENIVQITLNAEYLFEFRNKTEWINRAKDEFRAHKNQANMAEKLVCITNDGFVLTIGADFEWAKQLDAYPVKVYRLVRVSEIEKPLEP